MDPPRGRSERAGPDSELAAEVEDLAVHVQPVPHPGRREGMPPAESAHRLARIFCDRAEAAPEIDDSEKVGPRIGESALGRLRRRLAPGGPFAGIGHAQEARDDQHVGHATERIRFEQHPPDSRVERQSRQPPADLRQPAVGVERPQLAQQPQAVVDVAPVGRVDEREPLHVAQAEREHAQQHRREVGAPDLGLGMRGPGLEVRLFVQPDARSGADPPASSGPLVGRCLRNRLHRQPLHAGAVRIPAHPGGARIDDEADAGDGQRGLGDVRREHHPATGRGREQRLLARRRHPGMEGKELRIRPREAPQPGLGLPDLAFAGQEYEHVARRVADLLERPRDLPGDIVVLRAGPIADLDRMSAALHLDDRCLVEERAQLLHLQGGRGHHDSQVRAPAHEPAQVAEDEVDVERPFVRFVDDEGVVGPQVAVALDLGEQDAVGHQLDAGLRRGVPAKPHLPAHEPTEVRTKLRRDAGRHAARGNPPGLGVADHRARAAPRREADLRELGALARAGGPDHQRDRMLGHRARDARRVRGDRKVGRNRCHMHVKFMTDGCHEGWIQGVARGLKRPGGSAGPRFSAFGVTRPFFLSSQTGEIHP